MLRVIGSGFPRTGTKSLQVALQRLLGGPCYHMSLVFERLDDIAVWRRAAAGEPVDWHELLDGCVGAVDWPASVFWAELADAFPDALIVHSERTDPASWWTSADATILRVLRGDPADGETEWHAMARELLAREVGPDWDDPSVAAAAYERHNLRVRTQAAGERVLFWRADMGWEPLCSALGVPVPDEPFPYVNRTEDWRAAERRQADAAGAADT